MPRGNRGNLTSPRDQVKMSEASLPNRLVYSPLGRASRVKLPAHEWSVARTERFDAGYTTVHCVLSRFQRVNRPFAIKLVVAQMGRQMRL